MGVGVAVGISVGVGSTIVSITDVGVVVGTGLGKGADKVVGIAEGITCEKADGLGKVLFDGAMMIYVLMPSERMPITRKSASDLLLATFRISVLYQGNFATGVFVICCKLCGAGCV